MINKRKNTHNLSLFPSEKNNFDNQFKWQIWLLKTNVKKRTKSSLFYSWVVPCMSGNKGWKSETTELSENIPNEEGELVKVELLKVEYIGTGHAISIYIEELRAGKFLNEIDTEQDASYPPISFHTLSLGENSGDVAKRYVSRPEVLLPLEHLLIPWPSRSIPNPTDYSIFVSQLFYLEKNNLISFSGYELNAQLVQKLIQKISSKLKKVPGSILPGPVPPVLATSNGTGYLYRIRALNPSFNFTLAEPGQQQPPLYLSLSKRYLTTHLTSGL